MIFALITESVVRLIWGFMIVANEWMWLSPLPYPFGQMMILLITIIPALIGKQWCRRKNKITENDCDVAINCPLEM